MFFTVSIWAYTTAAPSASCLLPSIVTVGFVKYFAPTVSTSTNVIPLPPIYALPVSVGPPPPLTVTVAVSLYPEPALYITKSFISKPTLSNQCF